MEGGANSGGGGSARSNPLTARLKFGAKTSQKTSLRARQAALAPKPKASRANRRFVPKLDHQHASSTGVPLKGGAGQKLKPLPGVRPGGAALPSPARDSSSDEELDKGRRSRGSLQARFVAEEAPESFVNSLRLNPQQLAEFRSGSFLYLRESNKVGDHGNLSAYNLEVIPHILIDPKNYYTISQQGITHFRGDSVAFTDLDSWERNFQTFWSIRHIRFFQVYKKWKAFYQWTKWLSNLRIQRAGSSLQTNLFLFNMRLQKPLLHLHANCQAAREKELIEVEPSTTYRLSEFIEVQNNRRHAVSDWLSNFMKQVVLLVRGACDDVLDKFLSKNRIDGDHKLTFMERASLRKECQKLVRFVRMTDFVLQDTLRFVAVQSAAAFNHHVSPDEVPPRKVYLSQAEHDGSDDPEAAAAAAAATTAAMNKSDASNPAKPLFTVEVSFDEAGENHASHQLSEKLFQVPVFRSASHNMHLTSVSCCFVAARRNSSIVATFQGVHCCNRPHHSGCRLRRRATTAAHGAPRTNTIHSGCYGKGGRCSPGEGRSAIASAKRQVVCPIAQSCCGRCRASSGGCS